jgi:alkyl hydroperoxide reductase subunit AhpC
MNLRWGAVIRAYGVLDEDRNVAYRSTFVIDRGLLRCGQAGDRHMVRDGRRSSASST